MVLEQHLRTDQLQGVTRPNVPLVTFGQENLDASASWGFLPLHYLVLQVPLMLPGKLGRPYLRIHDIDVRFLGAISKRHKHETLTPRSATPRHTFSHPRRPADGDLGPTTCLRQGTNALPCFRSTHPELQGPSAALAGGPGRMTQADNLAPGWRRRHGPVGRFEVGIRVNGRRG